jgi:cell division protein ZapA
MPQIDIVIGGRTFDVACQEGEEHYLQIAAGMLDNEAASLAVQVGRMPEARMLLMAGLMLADKTAGLEEKVREAEQRNAELQARIGALEARGAPPAERIEVPVVPQQVYDALAEIAAQAEALAETVEEKAAS